MKEKEGNIMSKRPLPRTHNLKVYTKEEICLVNALRAGLTGKIVNIKDREIIIKLPSLNGVSYPAKINWLEALSNRYFRAGLSYLNNSGTTEWTLKLDSKGEFRPLFCSLHWRPEEKKIKEDIK